MTREHDPPHIRLYDWPNVPGRAKELADTHDIDNILCVAVVRDDMLESYAFGEISETTEHIDDGDALYCFIH